MASRPGSEPNKTNDGQPLKVEIEGRKKRLRELINSSGAYYDSKKQLFDIDRIWNNPKILDEFADNLAKFISQKWDLKKFNAILAADNAHDPYGCVPVAVMLSVKLDLPLMIWKENADIVTNASHLWGKREGAKVLVIHDVTRHGLTFVKELEDLRDAKCDPELMLTIVKGKEPPDEISASEYVTKKARKLLGRDVEFAYVLDINDLG